MLTPKEKVLDRIEQSFFLFKKNFKQIFLPLFLYKILTLGFIFSIISYFVFSLIDLTTFNNINTGIFADGNINLAFNFFASKVIYIILIYFISLIAYFLLVIPFFIATLKAIKNSYFEVENNMKDNIFYGFSRILKIFKTYWYIFAYVFLIPALAFIFGGLLFLYGNFQNINEFISFGSWILFFSVVLFITFTLYRGIETTFSLYTAIDKDEFEKENFDESVNLTKNNWWRIVGNMILISIIIGFGLGLISGIISNIINIGNNIDYSAILNGEKINLETLNKLKEFNIFKFIGNFLDIFITLLGKIFIFIFIYIFYKRIELEKNNDNTSKEELKIINTEEKINEL